MNIFELGCVLVIFMGLCMGGAWISAWVQSGWPMGVAVAVLTAAVAWFLSQFRPQKRG